MKKLKLKTQNLPMHSRKTYNTIKFYFLTVGYRNIRVGYRAQPCFHKTVIVTPKNNEIPIYSIFSKTKINRKSPIFQKVSP